MEIWGWTFVAVLIVTLVVIHWTVAGVMKSLDTVETCLLQLAEAMDLEMQRAEDRLDRAEQSLARLEALLGVSRKKDDVRKDASCGE